jgi:hypothetical protein
MGRKRSMRIKIPAAAFFTVSVKNKPNPTINSRVPKI